MTKTGGWAAIVFLTPLPALAQRGGNRAASTPEAKPAPEEGIPVTDLLVIYKCGGCHTRDAKGKMRGPREYVGGVAQLGNLGHISRILRMDRASSGKSNPPCFKQDQTALFDVQASL